MKHKGFTIVELLAVIAILGILALLLIPNIIKVRKDYLEKTYESRIRLIHNAALDWASDNLVNIPSHVSNEYNGSTTIDSNCAKYCNTTNCYLTVGYLIENNYLSKSDTNCTGNNASGNGCLKNPLTNENLNTKKVCVRYDNNDVFNRKLIAYIEE